MSQYRSVSLREGVALLIDKSLPKIKTKTGLKKYRSRAHFVDIAIMLLLEAEIGELEAKN